MKISKWREEIDLIDEEIVRLINRRARAVGAVGRLKAQAGLAVVDPDREREVLERVSRLNTGYLNDDSLARIFSRIIQESRGLQNQTRAESLCRGIY